MKIRQNNDVIDWIGLDYAKNDTKLSIPIRLGVVCDEIR